MFVSASSVTAGVPGNAKVLLHCEVGEPVTICQDHTFLDAEICHMTDSHRGFMDSPGSVSVAGIK